MKYKLITALIIGLFSINIHAQTLTKEEYNLFKKLSEKKLNFRIGAAYSFVIPQGEFQDHLNSNGHGLSLSLGYKCDSLPLSFGINFDYIHFNKVHNDYFDNDLQYNGELTILNQILPITVFCRYEPLDNIKFIPFIETNFGLQFISSERVNDKGSSIDNNIPPMLVYSIGGGLQFMLYEGINLIDSSVDRLYFDFGAYYRASSTVKFNVYSGNYPNFSIKELKTDLNNINLKFGLVYNF